MNQEINRGYLRKIRYCDYILVLCKGTVFLLNSDDFSYLSISFLHDFNTDFESL